MSGQDPQFDLESQDESSESGRGGFVALAVIAAAIGAGAALLLAPESGATTRERVGRGLRRRRNQARRETRLVGLAGFLIGAGLAATLNPQSGPVTRERLGSTLGRLKVGAIARIRRKSEAGAPDAGSASHPVRSVQELGRDPNTVF